MSAPSQPADPLIGTVVDGRYRVEARVGHGGMGVVYRCAMVRVHDRPCALKVIAGLDAARRSRFEREIRLVSRLTSPHTVQVFDSGQLPAPDHRPFVVMELLEGQPLDALLARGPVPPAQALRVVDGVLTALVEAHGKGIVHRDLKPANVFVVPTRAGPHAKVLDFGIAKALGGALAGADLTGDAAIGTPRYMAPEQFGAGPVDPRADLYAVGLLLHAMLVGRPPYSDAGALPPALQGMPLNSQLAWLQINAPLPTVAGSMALGAWLARATAKEPAERFRDAVEAGEQLRGVPEWRQQGAVSAPPAPASPSLPPEPDTTDLPLVGVASRRPRHRDVPWPWVAAGVVLLVGAGAALLWRSPPVLSAAAPRLCRDHVDAHPAGTRVVSGAGVLGQVPLELARPCGEVLPITLEAPGFTPTAFELRGGGRAWRARLDPLGDAGVVERAPDPAPDAGPPRGETKDEKKGQEKGQKKKKRGSEGSTPPPPPRPSRGLPAVDWERPPPDLRRP